MSSEPVDKSADQNGANDHPDGPAKKRQRVASETTPVEGAFAPNLLSSETRSELAKHFAQSKPYLHCRIDKLIDDSLLRKVRAEITAALHFTVKETDIYKVTIHLSTPESRKQ